MTLNLTFQGHSRSNVMVSFDSPFDFPIDIYRYMVTTCLSLTVLALIAMQNILPHFLLLGPSHEKSQVHQMTPKWHWMLQGQRHTIYVSLLPVNHKFHSFCSTIARFLDNWTFCFSIGYNGEFEIPPPKKKTQNFKYPKRSFVRTIGTKIQDKFEAKIWLWFVGGVAFEIFIPFGFHANEKENEKKILEISVFKMSKIPSVLWGQLRRKCWSSLKYFCCVFVGVAFWKFGSHRVHVNENEKYT